MSLPIGLQLYTVREPMSKDFEGTLKQLAEMGMPTVEFAGLYEREPDAVRDLVQSLGLGVSSAHVPIAQLEGKTFDQWVNVAKTIGFKYLVVPALPGELRESADGYRKTVQILTDANKRAQQHGLTVCYHNHSFEFDKLPDGSRGIDILYDGTSAEDFSSELDVYWVQHGGEDPLDWMDKLAGRVPLLHIKDMKDDGSRGFVEVGTGCVDIAAVVAKAPSVGSEYLLIEQDSNWAGSPLESVQTSLTNLKKIVGS